MRKWLVSFAVKYITNEIKEKQVEVEAASFWDAYRTAAAEHVAPALKEQDAERAVIWEVCIAEGQPLF